MSLYTFIMDYRGGTYISQVKANSLPIAKKKWIDKLDHKEIKHFGLKTKQELADDLKTDNSVLIQKLKNIWFSCFSVKGGFIIVHIIKTER